MKNITCSQPNKDGTSQSKKRNRFAIGNQAAWKHGRYSAGKIAAEKAGRARVKALGLIASALGLSPARNRPLREDQLAAVLADQELRFLAFRAGVLASFIIR